MKKIIALIFCFVFIFASCSGNTEKKTELNEDNFASYVGAGEMTLINILVNANAEFVNDVFKKNHLPVDETKIVKNAQGTFAPVVSDRYKNLTDLKEHIASVYCEDSVDYILGTPEKYVDIDGKLYFNMKYAESDYKLDWSEPVVSASINTDGKYEITITVKNEKGKDHPIIGHAVSENGSLKLETIYF